MRAPTEQRSARRCDPQKRFEWKEPWVPQGSLFFEQKRHIQGISRDTNRWRRAIRSVALKQLYDLEDC